MSKKKFLSGLISMILAVSMILSLTPAFVQAKSPLGDEERLAVLRKIDYEKEVYHSPEEKIDTMTKAAENDRYALYIQEYTVEVAVVDKTTGQMLFTNPWDLADSTGNVKNELLSQIKMKYTDREGSSHDLNSFDDAVKTNQVVIKQIRNGVRVEYSIGSAQKKRLVPYQIEKSRFETLILKPLFESFAGTSKESVDMSFEEYIALKNSTVKEEQDAAKKVENSLFDFGKFVSYYSLADLNDPSLTARDQASMLQKYPITEREAIYVIDETQAAKAGIQSLIESMIKEYTDYTLEDMIADHEETGYEMQEISPPLFRMALEYTLEDEGFQVRLPARGISYDSATYTLGEIQVLPFLGAGRVSLSENVIRRDEGYNFIPDGSGAIISFDPNNRVSLVSGTMYGMDFGFYNGGGSGASATSSNYQTWRVPVYGTVMDETYTVAEDVVKEEKNEDGEVVGTSVLTPAGDYSVKQGYVAFMTEGESLTRIDSISGADRHEYRSMGTTFFARQSDSYPLDGITVDGASAFITKSIQRKYVGNYTIKYRLLYGEEASYVGMANAYRSYLIKEGILSEKMKAAGDANLYLDLIGAIDNTVQILGVPVKTKAALTTFENAETIMNELGEAGVSNQVLRYLGWMNGGMASTAPAKLNVEGKLGGKNGLEKLIAAVQGAGNQIFMDLDFAYVHTVGTFDGFDEGKETAKTIDGKTAFFKTYNPVVQTFNTQVAYVIASNRISALYNKIAAKYAALFKDGEKAISVGTLGSALSSSQDENFPMNREDAKSYLTDALGKIAADNDHVMVEKGNIYTWRYAEHILNVPLDSSNRTDTSGEVPFMGILLHGYKHFTGDAINLAGDYEYNILKTVENGADPYFVIAYQNTALLKTNGYGAYYAVNYDTWKENIISEYKRIDGALKNVQDQRIIDHKILNNRVVVVTYENGCAIYLNYNNFEVTQGEITIPAMDFVVTGVR